MTTLPVDHFTDPTCPWAWSAEPQRLRLRWLYGDQLDWRTRMVVLAQDREEPLSKGLDPAKQAKMFGRIQERFGMPMVLDERPRMVASIDACRTYVGARMHAPDRADDLLRRLRVNHFAGALLDDRATLDACATEAGIDPEEAQVWRDDPGVERALREDMGAARQPSPAALALDHKLATWGDDGDKRYTCPSYEIGAVTVPGFQPQDVYSVAVANAAPQLARRPDPESVEEALAWAEMPLATVEVALVACVSVDDAREQLTAVADEEPCGAESFWRLRL